MRIAIFLMAMTVCAQVALGSPFSLENRSIQTFWLKDSHGKVHSLGDYGDQKLIVVAFLGTECPLVKLYAERLAEYHRIYASQGVAFLAINSNRQDSLAKINAYARRHELPFPILKDLRNRVADHFGAERTPEVFVLDEKRVIRYRGRIDDQYGIGTKRPAASRSDLKVAIDQLLAGQKVEVTRTEAPGCLIGRVRPVTAEAEVTYSSHIAQILQKNCVECHRSGQIGPFALTDYEEVVGWADMIGEVVSDERMPPWHADDKHGVFKNNRKMSQEDKDLIRQWVASGAPEGDRQLLPESHQWPEGWNLPTAPDEVFAMSETSFKVPAQGQIDYQYFTVDPGFKEDRWISAAQIIPGNLSVVHHVIVSAQPKSEKPVEYLIDFRGYLASYVPGLAPKPYPQGMAKRIPAGSVLTFQVHYTAVGTSQLDCCKLGLVYADPKTLTHEVRTTSAIQTKFTIPAGARNHRVDAQSPVAQADLLLLSMMPHMHMRGKAFQYRAVYPGGRQETLLRIPRYDFNWQTCYHLKQHKVLPAGTRIECTAHFDNSALNLNNPDPTRAVRWGPQAWDEMMVGYFDVAMPMSEPSIAGR